MKTYEELQKMKKEDLMCGNVVETRNKQRYLIRCEEDDIVNLSGMGFMKLSRYNDDLKNKGNDCIARSYDIMKVYEDYTCKKLLWERKENKLTEDEKAILRNMSEEYKYISRDSNVNLYIYADKPKKLNKVWSGNDDVSFEMFNHLFQFIKWEDEEPYLIEDLLKEEN